MFGQLGFTEVLIIILILVFLFGVNKIPQLGKGLGEGIRNFKSALREIGEDSEEKPKAEKHQAK
jgi:sec-independent protein translocase protein TatA